MTNYNEFIILQLLPLLFSKRGVLNRIIKDLERGCTVEEVVSRYEETQATYDGTITREELIDILGEEAVIKAEEEALTKFIASIGQRSNG